MRRKAYLIAAMVLGLTISLMLLPSQAVQAADLVHYVDDDNCPGPGTGTQIDPFCSIQSGIDAASSGYTVLVAAGTYYENIFSLLGEKKGLLGVESEVSSSEVCFIPLKSEGANKCRRSVRVG